MSFSNDVENALLSEFLTLYPTLFVALSRAAPTEDGSGVDEPSTGGYIRQPAGDVTLTGNAVTNDVTISFPLAGADWGTITHVALFNAESAGTFLGWAAITSFACPALTQVTIAAGTTIVSLD